MSQMYLKICYHDDHRHVSHGQKMESKINYTGAYMDKYNPSPIRKIKTHKIIHMNQICSEYKLITIYIHKNITNYLP